MKSPISTFLAGLLLTLSAAPAADLPGTVRSASGNTAEVILTGDLVPATGDKATIFFTLPGGDDEVQVATASVVSVGADSVQLKVENATGAVAKDQQVRITSASPQKRTATPAKPPVGPGDPPPGPGPGTPPSPPVPKDPSAPPVKGTTENVPSIRLVDSDDPHMKIPPGGVKLIPIPRGGAPDHGPAGKVEGPGEFVPAFAPHSGNGAVPVVVTNGAVVENPKTATEHFNLGYSLLAGGKPAEATAAFTRALKLEPRYATAWYFRARAGIDTKDHEAVVEDASRAIELGYTKLDDAYCTRGTGWAGQGDFEKAAADHSKAIALNASHALAWNNRANDHLFMDDDKAAIADCMQAIVLDPKSPLPYYNRGFANYRLDNVEEAIANWNMAVQLQPSFKKELEPLIKECKAGLSDAAHALPERDGKPTGEELKAQLKNFVPPGAKSSKAVR